MKKIELKDKTLIINDQGIKQFDLDKLRLVFLFFPGQFSWYVVTSSQKINSLNIDSLDENEIGLLEAEFSVMEIGKAGLKSFQFYLANYKGQSTIITLKDLVAAQIPLLSFLKRFKKERIEHRKQWLETYPQLELKGSLGSKMTLTIDGLQIKKKFLEWEKVSTYEIEDTYFGTSHFRIIPEGVSTGLFSFAKHKYTVGNISTKKYPQFMAECEFWRGLKDAEGSNDLVSKLKKLQQLKEDGVLTNKRFIEAKKKLLVAE